MTIQTRLLPAASPPAIAEAAQCLQQGQLVAFPTDTVYGVGAALTTTAVARLFAAKKRPSHKGIPVLIADLSDIDQVARSISGKAYGYISRYWPGPLTLILPAQPHLPQNLTPHDTVAVRMPDTVVTRTLIRQAGGAIAASSANRSGQPPAQTAVAAGEALSGLVTIVLDGGAAPQGQASTILDCTVDPPRLLRLGPITAVDLDL